MKPSPDPLEPLLAEWRVRPRRNAHFRTEVWARIEAARGTATWPAYVRAHAGTVMSVIAVAAAVGAVGGWTQARARVEADSNQVAASYVQTLDARKMRMP